MSESESAPHTLIVIVDVRFLLSLLPLAAAAATATATTTTAATTTAAANLKDASTMTDFNNDTGVDFEDYDTQWEEYEARRAEEADPWDNVPDQDYDAECDGGSWYVAQLLQTITHS
ncbi:hypothetical protein HDU86_005468 [Geranomyces michiganensis]|nr:hypothetical protein HDU86_005468 [Geranomyces michiganensis]